MTYPKNGDSRLRESVKQLKAQVSRLRKENDALRQELLNVMKIEHAPKEKVKSAEPRVMTSDEWRREFVKKFKPKIKRRLEEISEES